jgi:four helix bundle protein
MSMSSYQNLIIWQKAIDLVKQIYTITNNFPKSELYGLTSQIRRASVSIPSNIAEGHGRRTSKEFAQFYSVAYGSTLELETQLYLAKELGFLSNEDYGKIHQNLQEVSKMLNSITYKLKLKSET